MLATLEGLDHVVVMVHDLDAAAEQWRALGFTVSPRGTHSAHLGTGNYTLMFEDDYLELLGVLQATEHNTPSRDFLARRGEGLEQAAFRTRDAAEGAAALARQGVQAIGPLHFSRPVNRPDGSQAEAAFSIFSWPPAQRPADLRIFGCQHHTRDAVWLPELTRHANTVAGIRRIEAIAADPAAAAQTLAGLLDTTAETSATGALVRTGTDRADIHFMTAEAFAQAYAVPAGTPLPSQGAIALVLRVHDLDAAARCVGPAAWRTAHGIATAPALASGVLLAFEPA